MISGFPRRTDPTAAAAWFATDAGEAVLASEAAHVQSALLPFPRQRSLWLGPAADPPEPLEAPLLLRLHPGTDEPFAGGLRCGLPLPIASECCAVVVVQHLADMVGPPQVLLEECARVLIPGGLLWLFALNPLSPWRLRWGGHGMQGREPMVWRRKLRQAGLQPEPVSYGLGPDWRLRASRESRPGVGLRPAFLLRSEKRTIPLTPLRSRRAVGSRAGTMA